MGGGEAIRKHRNAWGAGIKEVDVPGEGRPKPVSEQIEGLNAALRRRKRMLRSGPEADSSEVGLWQGKK